MLMKKNTHGGMRHALCRRALLLLLLAVGCQARSAVSVHAMGNLTMGSCDIALDTRGDTIKMRGALASEFDTAQTAVIMPFEMAVYNCSGTTAGGTFDVTVTGTTLNSTTNVFNDDTTSDVGFMLKENGHDTFNYWVGTKNTYFNAPGTVENGQPNQLVTLNEDNPMLTRLNYMLGLVTPLTNGGVDPTPRHVQANLVFNINYR